jgi:molybdopterin-containing oxidoreductase family membrane subunit
VIGAILSGVAAVITLMIAIRKAFHLEEYLTPLHFDNMGKLLLVISLLWSYAYFAEVYTTWYAHEPIEWEVFSFMSGRYTPQLLIMLVGNSLLPITALCFKQLRRSIGVMLVVSLGVNVAMFIERFLIIIPSLSHKNMPFVWGTYHPSPVEILINLAALAGFILLYLLFAKFFPIVAISEVHELEERRAEIAVGRAKLPAIIEEE